MTKPPQPQDKSNKQIAIIFGLSIPVVASAFAGWWGLTLLFGVLSYLILEEML